MGTRLSWIVGLVAVCSGDFSAAAEEKASDTKPRSWMAFYTGSANYTGTGGDLDAVRYGVSFGSDMEFGKNWLAGGSVSVGKQHFTAPDIKGDSKDVFLGLYARRTFLGNGYVLGAGLLGWHDANTLRQVGL